MQASTELVVAVDATGRSRLVHATCEVPLLFRVADHDGPDLRLSWVNGAAGPLGGDVLRVALRLEAGASVAVRSAGATLAQPGPHGGCSLLEVALELGEGSRLDWCPEPTVSVRGSRHRSTMRISAQVDAEARVVDQVVLGRHGEPCGWIALHQRVEVAGRPILDHEVELGPGALSGPGAHGAGRAVLSAVLIGERWRPAALAEVTRAAAAASFELGPSEWLVTATGPDLRGLSHCVPAPAG